VQTDTDTGTLYQVLCFILALLSSLNYIVIDYLTYIWFHEESIVVVFYQYLRNLELHELIYFDYLFCNKYLQFKRNHIIN
jgi:hypothetical protein